MYKVILCLSNNERYYKRTKILESFFIVTQVWTVSLEEVPVTYKT